jgi:hypothetical protein
VPRARVVGLDQDQARFEPRDVESLDPGRPDAEGFSGRDERVPEFERSFGLDPELVAEVPPCSRCG